MSLQPDSSVNVEVKDNTVKKRSGRPPTKKKEVKIPLKNEEVEVATEIKPEEGEVPVVKKTIVKKEVKKLEKDHIKYVVLLKLLNKILVNIGNTEIDDVTFFVNVDREQIIKASNIPILNSMEDELFPLFNRRDCGFDRDTHNIVLVVLRGMMKETGYKLNYKKREINEEINGKKYRAAHTFYSIQ
jgi:hypothetical protein